MNKGRFFAGQPVFTQLVKLLPKAIIDKAAANHQADRYYKKFDSYHHLITMLYACFQQCTSLREVSTGMRACERRLQSLGIKHMPARSTFAEANEKRTYKVFEDIYQQLYKHYRHIFPDSRWVDERRELFIIDSSSITLFKEVMQGTSKRINGKRKGAVKVHMAINAHEDVPCFVDLTKGGQADVSFLKKLDLPPDSIVVMDRAYNDYDKYAQWNAKGIDWVTRSRQDSRITVLYSKIISDEDQKAGMCADEAILLGAESSANRIECRRVTYWDSEHHTMLRFLTNNLEWSAFKVANVYKRRWQIELLFKRLKQNMPLQYFLGDNENAIKIQIYCALIADLLLKISAAGLRRRWAFSNICGLVRLHLMNYTNLKKFLENPEKASIINPELDEKNPQLNLFNDT